MNAAHPHAALDLRAVDRLIAEKIMELTPRQRQWGVGHLLVRRTEWLDRDGHVVSDMPGEFAPPFHVAPYYTSTWDAAGQVLEWMREHSQSVTLNWGEDNDLWECSWITSGKRYTEFSKSAPLAICLAALAALGVEVDQPASTQTPRIHDSEQSQ